MTNKQNIKTVYLLLTSAWGTFGYFNPFVAAPSLSMAIKTSGFTHRLVIIFSSIRLLRIFVVYLFVLLCAVCFIYILTYIHTYTYVYVCCFNFQSQGCFGFHDLHKSRFNTKFKQNNNINCCKWILNVYLTCN